MQYSNRYTYTLFAMFIFCVSYTSCTKKIIPEKPALNNNIVDTLPLSDIDIPVQIPLQPIVKMAESQIELQYVSDGYPNDFVVDSCTTRYMYRFRRGPVKLTGHGSELKLEFLGYYAIAGSQRLCAGVGSSQTAITPWSPPCTCGLKEAERRVQVGYTIDMRLNSNFSLQPLIKSLKPVPLDKCNMCFWSYDITSTIMDRLLVQMDDARKAIEDSIRIMQLRPKFQQLWDSLSNVISLAGLGYLRVNPEKLRISRLHVQNDTLVFSLGISARPVITQQKPAPVLRTVIPDISDFQLRSGFSLHLDAQLDYDSLSRILNQKLYKKRIDIEQVGKHVIIENCQIYGADGEKLIFKLDFSGSETGTFYLTGNPAYDVSTKQLSVNNLDYDIRTKDMLVKTAKWLFNKKILQVLQSYTKFDLNTYEKSLISQVNNQVPKELYPGVWVNGAVNAVTLDRLMPSKEKLIVRLSSTGNLRLTLTKLEW
ncbi:DUF4403 family protein [Pollutibacter soli]|uniref:DUF4403 family protein n=1 Tax=Pollutibacter soli TaxID=3034157 RepID=UPI0030133115